MTSSPVPGVHVDSAVLRAATIVQLMTHVPDPRQRRSRRHPLVVVLILAVGAVTAGARSLTRFGEWAHDVGADLLDLVDLTGAVPSEATIRRVIEALDAGVFARLCGAWMQLRWRQVDGQGVLAVDGKTECVNSTWLHRDGAVGPKQPCHFQPTTLAAFAVAFGDLTLTRSSRRSCRPRTRPTPWPAPARQPTPGLLTG